MTSEISPSPAGPSLQEKYSPRSECFGCGPRNPRGMRIRSFPAPALASPAGAARELSAGTAKIHGEVGAPNEVVAEEIIADWKPETFHEAFTGIVNGGVIGTLLDCHCNWTAAYHLMKATGETEPPCTVTADYAIKLLRPTPSDAVLHLSAKVVEAKADRATVEGTLSAAGKICATCRGTFVAVKPGHPAYHRW